ncbi:MAG: sensor histidine kinase [Thermomicrobiales bacterium]
MRGILFVRLIERSRGIGIRIASITMLLVVVSLVIPAMIIIFYIHDTLEQHVSGQISEEMARLTGIGTSNAPDIVVDAINKQLRADASREFAYHIVTREGKHIAGDGWLKPGRIGWNKTSIPGPGYGGREATQLLILTAPLGSDLTISVGRQVGWIRTVELKLRELMLWGVLGGIALAAITAYLVNRLIAGRLDIISDTAVAIMDGDLSLRIPLTGADDDFDRLSAMLNAALGRIQELMQSLQQVSSDIAHDLRTPLGRLLQGLERARREATSTEEYAKAVDGAILEAEGLLTTFTALLRIAQIEGGARRSALRDVMLSEVLDSVVEAYALSAEEGGRSLTTDIRGQGRIRGDRDLLMQLFANLIENSLTHTLPESNIVVALKETSSGVTASVSDDGPGVPDNERDKIFQRFYRLEASRTSAGTGLGLSLVAAVAKLHGARLDVENTHPGLRVAVIFGPQAQT